MQGGPHYSTTDSMVCLLSIIQRQTSSQLEFSTIAHSENRNIKAFTKNGKARRSEATKLRAQICAGSVKAILHFANCRVARRRDCERYNGK